MSEFTLAIAEDLFGVCVDRPDLTLFWLCMWQKLKKTLANLSHIF